MRMEVRGAASGFLLALAGSLCLGQTNYVQPDETLPGFKSGNVFEVRGVDNVNPFSGDTSISIPLSPTYTLSAFSKWQLGAYYSPKLWRMDAGQCINFPAAQHAYLRGDPTLGVGWTLNPGYIGASGVTLATGYFGPDGGFHAQPPGSNLTLDGSHLRIAGLGTHQSPYTVEYPDGTRHTFDHPFNAPRPTAHTGNVTSPDFTELYWTAVGLPTGQRYGLSQVEDSFRNVVLKVDYNDATGKPWEVKTITLTTLGNQTIDYAWVPITLSDGTYSVTWDVVDHIDFPVFGSTKRRAKFTYYTYSQSVFQRNNYDNSASYPSCQNVSPAVYAPVLQKITFTDTGTPASFSYDYSMTYFLTRDGTFGVDREGALQQLTLPTGGTINYTYSNTPLGCLIGTGCSPDTAADSQDDPSQPPPPALANGSQHWRAFMDNSILVATRCESPTASCSAQATTTYFRKHFYNSCQGSQCQGYDWNPLSFIRRVDVVGPGNDTGGTAQFLTRYYFHAPVSVDETPVYVDGGLDLERRYYTDATPTTIARDVISCYGDPPPAACGYHDSAGTLRAWSMQDLLPKQAEITWFGAVPTGTDGGSCSGSTLCTASSNTTLVKDGSGQQIGKYETTTLTSTLTPMSGWTSRVSTTDWTPQVTASFWNLNLYDYKQAVDNGSGIPLPTSSKTTFSFNTGNGFLNNLSTTDTTYGSVTHTFTPDASGNPGTHQIGGSGGTTKFSGTAFTDTMTFSAGQPLSVQRATVNWKSFDADRDFAMGLISKSRDPNTSLFTNYSYDELARPTLITPPGSEAPTAIAYDSAAQTTASRTGVDGNGTWQRLLYDGLGRLVRELRQMPVGYSFRTRSYDSAGHPTFVSEWKSCSSVTSPSGDCLTLTAPGTTYSSFDPFGRAQSITRADASLTTVSYSDGSIPFSDTLESVTVSVNGSSSTTTTRKDPLGRVIAVTEPSVTGSTTNRTTNYLYNALDKLGQVQQQDDATPTPHTQTRSFIYDTLGYLRSETTPEKGNAAVTYDTYDALGDSLQQSEPPPGSSLITLRCYDAAGRLTSVRSNEGLTPPNLPQCGAPGAGRVYLGQIYDETSHGSSNGRLTTRNGYNWIPTQAAIISDSFTYGSGAGRLSSQTTTGGNGDLSFPATQTWSYNSLGLISSRTDPRVAPPSFTVGTSYSQGLPYAVGASPVIQANGTNVVPAVSYNPASGLLSWTAGNTGAPVVTSITQDTSLLPRPRQIKAAAGATTLFDTGVYSYDGVGNITGIAGENDTFTYDLRSRLASAVLSGSSRSFTYDRFGSLTLNGSSSFTMDPGTNRITGGCPASPTSYYDSRGNMICYGGETMRYDGLNRQYRDINGGADWIYLYDGGGERIVKFPSGFTVLRREMARFVAEANVKAGKTGWTLSACATAPFTDVPTTDPDCPHVLLVKTHNITAGCGGGQYCPESSLTRAQMAVFVVLGYKAEPFTPPPCTGIFQDVTCNGSYAAYAPYIEQLYRDGVTGGCSTSPLQFCPASTIGEWEMLVWLATVPGAGAGTSWASYGPVPRGSIYTYRDEQNRIVTEATDAASGAGSATLSVTRDNVFLGNLLVASNVATGWQYSVSDHLGSPRYVFNSAGGFLESHRYWPYGEEVSVGQQNQRITFASMERDTEANRYNDHARHHDFNLGRFLSPDVYHGNIAEPGSWNRYTYAFGNPLSYIDPDGRESVPTEDEPRNPCLDDPIPCGADVSVVQQESVSVSADAPTGVEVVATGTEQAATIVEPLGAATLTFASVATGEMVIEAGLPAIPRIIGTLRAARNLARRSAPARSLGAAARRITTRSAKEVMRKFGLSREDFNRVIHDIKQHVQGNPDMEFDLETGEVFDMRSGEPVGNVRDNK